MQEETAVAYLVWRTNREKFVRSWDGVLLCYFASATEVPFELLWKFMLFGISNGVSITVSPPFPLHELRLSSCVFPQSSHFTI